MAKDVVDSEGVTFVSRSTAETGAEPADVARAHRIAREVTGAPARWAALEALDGIIDPVVQNELMSSVDWVVGLTGRWFLQNAPGADIAETIEANAAGFAELDAALPELVPEASREARGETAASLIARGAPEALAIGHVYMPALAHAPDVLVVARATGLAPTAVARAFFAAGQTLHLDWIETQVLGFAAESSWEQFALDAILDDLLLLRREAVHKAIVEHARGRPRRGAEPVPHRTNGGRGTARTPDRAVPSGGHERPRRDHRRAPSGSRRHRPRAVGARRLQAAALDQRHRSDAITDHERE